MSNFTYVNKVARAAAILTTAEVAGATMTLDNIWGGQVQTQVDFTIGSLTNVILRGYVSMDGVTFYQISDDRGVVFASTITATVTQNITNFPGGWKFFRVTAQGTGTVTSSSLALTYRALKIGSQ